MAARLAGAEGPVHFLMPLQGVEEWDREGEPAHDPEGLAAMIDEARKVVVSPVKRTEIDCHINDAVFSAEVLKILDAWIADGTVVPAA